MNPSNFDLRALRAKAQIDDALGIKPQQGQAQPQPAQSQAPQLPPAQAGAPMRPPLPPQGNPMLQKLQAQYAAPAAAGPPQGNPMLQQLLAQLQPNPAQPGAAPQANPLLAQLMGRLQPPSTTAPRPFREGGLAVKKGN